VVYAGVYDEGALTGTAVAVKKLANSHFDERDVFREVLLLSRCARHEHVVRLLGFCADSAADLCLVMEHLGGGTLADHLHKHAADVDARRGLGWLHQLATALHFLAQLRVVHIDLAPRNCMSVPPFRGSHNPIDSGSRTGPGSV
jgi:serine/threonine protein kinase